MLFVSLTMGRLVLVMHLLFHFGQNRTSPIHHICSCTTGGLQALCKIKKRKAMSLSFKKHFHCHVPSYIKSIHSFLIDPFFYLLNTLVSKQASASLVSH